MRKTSLNSLITITLTLVSLIILVLAFVNIQVLTWSEIIWLIALLISFVIRIPISRQVKSNRIFVSGQSVVENILLLSMFAGVLLLPGISLLTTWLDFADYSLSGSLIWLGASLQLPYLWLFWRSHADLGRNWSPTLELREQHDLVTEGVYKRVRHPMYSAIWLSVLAQPLLIHNWIAGIVVIPAFAVMCLARIPKEEAMMRRQFGDAYQRYMENTGRFLPS